MTTKRGLLQVVTLLLYVGPLVAGLAGHGWSVLPAFAAIFVLWQIIMRPADWPRGLDRWRDPGVILGALARVALMVVLVGICLGTGRGIGGALGFISGVPVAAPLALSFLSIPLARLFWDPVKAAELDAFVDDALLQVAAAGTIPPPARRDPMVDALLRLPDNADAGGILPLLDGLAQADGGAGRFDELVMALTAASPPRTALRRALILWASDPDHAPARQRLASVSTVWEVAGPDHDLHRLWLERAGAVLAAHPALWDHLPEPRELEMSIGTHNPEDVNAALSALSSAVTAAMPADLRNG